MSKFKHFRYGQKGFTFIEILVVVAIMSVLAAVAVSNVGKFFNKGKTETARTELYDVPTAVMAAMADSGAASVSGGGNSANSIMPPTLIPVVLAPVILARNLLRSGLLEIAPLLPVIYNRKIVRALVLNSYQHDFSRNGDYEHSYQNIS